MGMDVFFCRLMRGEMQGVKERLKIVCDGTIPTRHVNSTHALIFDGMNMNSPDSNVDAEPADTGVASGAQAVETV
jgi:hypothetical protein